ncbi:MAG: 2OG-Fe(II) oxygenase [Rhodospirillales bacterium]|nr:2OG-Fe(II) oxygenase [Rhodospirillales bacterium]
MPRIVLPLPAGGQIDFAHQTMAGRSIVLWLAPAFADPAMAGRLAALHQSFAAREAEIFAVLPAAISATLGGIPVLLDPENRVGQGFGLGAEGGIVVIDPGQRLAAICADAQGALATVGALFERTGHAPVLVIPAVLDPALCRRLIAYWQAGEKQRDAVSASEGGRSYADAGTKKRIDVAVTDEALDAELKGCIARRALPEIAKALQARLTHMEPFRIGCYDAAEGGYFRRHRDNATRFTQHRLFAITLNLNTGDYAGGDLRFPEYGRRLYRPAAGGAVVFSCALLHEVLPVTAGRRFGVFSFLYDAAGEVHVERVIAEERRLSERTR